MFLLDLINYSARQALLNKRKYLLPGNNGLYHDPETPVRNTGHWLIIFAKCYEWTSDKKYKNEVLELVNYLLTKKARPNGYSFYHRKTENKDKCNGLIGQAWSFEALAQATHTLGDEKFIKAAEDVFFQHNFNEHYGLWNRLEIDGKILSIDNTFNHQLWFAACSSLIKTKRQPEIQQQINHFMDCLPENLSVLENGLIYHPIERKLFNDEYSNKVNNKNLRTILKKILKRNSNEKSKKSTECVEYFDKMKYKSIGYHAFNMYAFALLKINFPDHSFWKSDIFLKTIQYMLSSEYKNDLYNNKYGYPYNPPGFEVAFALNILAEFENDELVDISEWWINEQFKRCFNPDTFMFDRNTEDPPTLTARLYEITRLPQNILNKIQIPN